MAREYAKLLTRIWADGDFKKLTANAQRLYFQIISQPDISMAGVVTLAEKRWSFQVGDQNETHISVALGELEGSLFVVVDRGTQEVLVRSYVRSDECWKSPTSMKGVDSAVRSVLSTGLKAVIRDELVRIDTSNLPMKVSERTGKTTREFVEGIIWGIAEDFKPLSHGVSDTPSHAPTDGHKRILHSTEPEPTPTTEPEPTPTTPKRGTRRPYPDDFVSFWAAYPKKDDKPVAYKSWEKALGRASAEEIIEGAARYRDDPNRDATFTKNASTWLNADAWENGPLPERSSGMKSFAQQESDSTMTMLQEFASQPWALGAGDGN